MKRFSLRSVIVLVVIAAACFYCIPTFAPQVWPHQKINLGLDLQGGMHLVLEVNTEKVIEGAIERNYQELRDLSQRSQISNLVLERPTSNHIAIRVEGQENIDKFKALLNKELRDLRLTNVNEKPGAYSGVLEIPDAEVANLQRLSVEQALETIRNRIDQFGVSEPDVRRQGENRILVQLPGIQETQRAKDLIGRTALLEFKLVDEANNVNAAVSGNVPSGSEVLYQVNEDRATRRSIRTPFLLKKGTLLTGASLTDARVALDSQYSEPYVSIEFDRKGARTFERLTGENVGKRLAIVLDNKVYSAPVIQEKIAGGKARITGRFTTEEARDLAIALRAGALPAPVTILEERSVGPSLGADSIRAGLIAMAVGGALLLLFMALYYRLSGILADFEVLLNIVLTGAGLAAFGATLTLPGIAGTILSVGMALDNNILIYERIREELRLGKTPRGAVDAGFDRATLTILDANVTTLLAAAVLYHFGTGPVRGFAVTLSLGVIASIFTAVVVSRVVFDYILNTKKVKSISIMSFEVIKSNINFDFVGKRKFAYTFSGILILLSLLSLGLRSPTFGVDFAGGSIAQVKFIGPVTIENIRDGLRTSGIDNVSVQSLGDVKEHEFLLRTDAMETGADFAARLGQNLETATGSKVEIRRLEIVGPQVGSDLKEKAMLAILISLLLTATYISGRFEFKWLKSVVVALVLGGAAYSLYTFNVPMHWIIPLALVVTLLLFWISGLKYALGAIFALIHDVIISAGVLSFLDKEFTVTVLAALLTIIGYSLNDTVIVYDRIRENILKLRKASLGPIINRSVNETLSRTIMTQGLTLVMVVSLYFLGGEIIHDFALALLVGIVVGTYSSIYVASPIVLTWEERTKKKLHLEMAR